MTSDLIAWMMRASDEKMVWIGVFGDHVLTGKWGGDRWQWNVTATPVAHAHAVNVTMQFEVFGFTMHAPPMRMSVDDPEFFKKLDDLTRRPDERGHHISRAFDRAVMQVAVAGVVV